MPVKYAYSYLSTKFKPFTFQIILVDSTILVQINFPQNLEVKNQPLDKRRLKETKTKHCKITCRFQLDIGPSMTESDVEFNWTFG
jgi:hypothetical protein